MSYLCRGCGTAHGHRIMLSHRPYNFVFLLRMFHSTPACSFSTPKLNLMLTYGTLLEGGGAFPEGRSYQANQNQNWNLIGQMFPPPLFFPPIRFEFIFLFVSWNHLFFDLLTSASTVFCNQRVSFSITSPAATFSITKALRNDIVQPMS